MMRRRRPGAVVGAATLSIAAADRHAPAPEYLEGDTPGVVYVLRAGSAVPAPKPLTCIPVKPAPAFRESTMCNQCHKEFTMVFRRHHCRNCGESYCGEHAKERRRLPWYCIGYSVRVCPSCQHVIDSGEYERGIVERHQQRVADIRSVVEGPIPVPAEALLKEDTCLFATAVPAASAPPASDGGARQAKS